jgi:hypothetical protein
MWAFAVGIYHLQLEEAVIGFQAEQLDSHIRRQFKDGSDDQPADPLIRFASNEMIYLGMFPRGPQIVPNGVAVAAKAAPLRVGSRPSLAAAAPPREPGR